jgi:uracil-DNA glycosylase family 4
LPLQGVDWTTQTARGRRITTVEDGSNTGSEGRPTPALSSATLATMNSERREQPSQDPAEALARLEESLRDCSLCGLCEGRTQVVFGVGSARADVMFVGEGPGFHEDRQGEPFVGQAGKLLTALLGEIGLARADVYIANVVKCRPPENRDPLPAEIEACSPHLMEQIAIIRPKIICTLGRFATKLLAETDQSMSSVHGRAKERMLAGVDTIIFPVFHPAAALYTPANRQVLQQDFAKLRFLLEHGLRPPDSQNEDITHEAEESDRSQAHSQRPTSQSSEGQKQLHLW